MAGWLGVVTGRQMDAWAEWFKLELNKPSRDNYYMMRVAAAVFQVNSKDKVELSEMRVKFRTEAPPTLTPKEESDQIAALFGL